LLILCGKREIIRLPPFESAKAPGYIESERNDGQHHYQEPVPEKPKPCSVKGQWAIVDKGVFGNPSLLCRIGPGEKEAEGQDGENPGPEKQSQTTQSCSAEINPALIHLSPR
jgi:hypothetical protein